MCTEGVTGLHVSYCLREHTHTHTFTHIHTHTHARTHIHKHTHTHSHTCGLARYPCRYSKLMAVAQRSISIMSTSPATGLFLKPKNLPNSLLLKRNCCVSANSPTTQSSICPCVRLFWLAQLLGRALYIWAPVYALGPFQRYNVHFAPLPSQC